LVTTFGFIGPGKGIEIGINAVAKLKGKIPEYNLSRRWRDTSKS